MNNFEIRETVGNTGNRAGNELLSDVRITEWITEELRAFQNSVSEGVDQDASRIALAPSRRPLSSSALHQGVCQASNEALFARYGMAIGLAHNSFTAQFLRSVYECAKQAHLVETQTVQRRANRCHSANAC